jgi:hypothetical protein
MKNTVKKLQGKAKEKAEKLGGDIKTTWDQLPAMVRIGAMLFGGIWIYKKVKGLGDGDTGKDASKDKKKFEKEGQVASYPSATYSGYADIIYNEYMNSVWTDFDDVVYIFRKMNNDLDVALLIEAFGMRRLAFSTFEGGLQSIIAKMDSDAPEKVNSIFASKGIDYRF